MKIGITLPKYYEDYLKEISSLNGMSITTICGLVLQNYLSYNKEQGRFPLFQPRIKVAYVEKQSSDDVSEDNKPKRSRDEMLDQINVSNEQYKVMDLKDDELPF